MEVDCNYLTEDLEFRPVQYGKNGENILPTISGFVLRPTANHVLGALFSQTNENRVY
jgi:hypothetical protein